MERNEEPPETVTGTKNSSLQYIHQSRPYQFDVIKSNIPFHICIHEAGHYVAAKFKKLNVESITLEEFDLKSPSSHKGSKVSLVEPEYDTEIESFVPFMLGGFIGEICSFGLQSLSADNSSFLFHDTALVRDIREAVNKKYKNFEEIKTKKIISINSGGDCLRNLAISLTREHGKEVFDYISKNAQEHDMIARKLYDKWHVRDFRKTILDENCEIDEIEN